MPSTENAVLKPTYWKILWKRVSTKYWQTYGIRLCSPMTNYWQEPLSPVVQPTWKIWKKPSANEPNWKRWEWQKTPNWALKEELNWKKTECPTPSLHCWLPEKKTVIALNIRENRLSPFKPDSLPKKEKVQKKKEEDWHRKLKKNAERKKLKSNALPTAKAL